MEDAPPWRSGTPLLEFKRFTLRQNRMFDPCEKLIFKADLTWLNKPFPDMKLDMEPGASVGHDGKYVQLPDIELRIGGGPDSTDGRALHFRNY